MLRRANPLALFLAIGIAGLPAAAAAAEPTERVLIRTARPYARLEAQVAALGGRTTHAFKYIDAIAAELPVSALPAIAAIVGDSAISKDTVLAGPAPVDTTALRRGYEGRGPVESESYEAVEPIDLAELKHVASAFPEAYLINNGILGTSPLHAMGKAGQGVIVGVIDSGIRPGFPHLELDGSVVGCEDFVGDANGCSHTNNNGHGTFVAGMISANVTFTFSTASGLRNAVLAECPGCFADPPAYTQIPMIGSAPLASIYAFRVFGPTGGAPTSRILAAIERLIELKEKYDDGAPDGKDIRIANLSLGGVTLFAGFDLFDREVSMMLAKGIVPVVAAGNAGPSSLTVGSPGTSLKALTVGAASLAHNERILRRAQLGPAVGSLYRPFGGTQTAYFSGRGPNANGFADPDVVANGFANYGQGFGATAGSISIGSGTSFATPSVAGVAALLVQSFPNAPAWKIRNAIIATADPDVVQDGSVEIDQGRGYVNAFAAHDKLASGRVPLFVDHFIVPTSRVAANVERGTDLHVRRGIVDKHVAGLLPGERYDVVYEVQKGTSRVHVTLAGVTPELPPAEQNQLFGDDVLLTIHSAKTSAIGEGDYKVFEFTTGGSFTIEDPEPGLLRVTVSGDWTNAGKVSADVLISPTREPLPGVTALGRLREGEQAAFPIEVPAGVGEAEFRLTWERDWAHYPSSDLDMVLVPPSGPVDQTGASGNSPEVVRIANPVAGTWYVLVSGFEVNAWKEPFKLRVALDGDVVH